MLEAAGDFARESTHDMSLATALAKIPQQNFDNTLVKQWWQMRLNLWTGADIDYLSARYWDQEETLMGDNRIILGGYAKITDCLAQGCRIIFNAVVSAINYQTSELNVYTQARDFSADAVLITVPLGVLKNNSIKFLPELSSEKLTAIDHLQMGVLNKIILKFPTIFWPNDYIYVSYLAENFFPIEVFVNYGRYLQQPILATVFHNPRQHCELIGGRINFHLVPILIYQ